MSNSRRVNRVEKEIRLTISQYILRNNIKNFLPALTTVSRVQASIDLKYVKVFVSVYGGENEQQEAIQLLGSHTKDFQAHIGRELKMRYCPKLQFILDRAQEQTAKIEKILSEIHAS